MCLDGTWEREQCAGMFKKASGYIVVSRTGAALWTLLTSRFWSESERVSLLESAAQPLFLRDEPNPAESNETESSVILAVLLRVLFLTDPSTSFNY